MGTVQEAIARHRILWLAGAETDDDLGVDWNDREAAAFEALAQVKLGSLADIVAIADYIAEQDDKALFEGRCGRLARLISAGAKALGTEP